MDNNNIGKGTKISYIISFVVLVLYLIAYCCFNFWGNIFSNFWSSFMSKVWLWIIMLLFVMSLVVSVIIAIINYNNNKKCGKKLLVMYVLLIVLGFLTIISLNTINKRYASYYYELLYKKANEIDEVFLPSESAILFYGDIKSRGVDLSGYDETSFITTDVTGNEYICLKYKNRIIRGAKYYSVGYYNYGICDPLMLENEENIIKYVNKYLFNKYGVMLNLSASFKNRKCFDASCTGTIDYLYSLDNGDYIINLKMEDGNLVIEENFDDYLVNNNDSSNDSSLDYSASTLDEFMDYLNKTSTYKKAKISYDKLTFIKEVNRNWSNYIIEYNGKRIKTFKLVDNNSYLYNMNFTLLKNGDNNAIVFAGEIGPVGSEAKNMLAVINLNGDVMLDVDSVLDLAIDNNIISYSIKLHDTSKETCSNVKDYSIDDVYKVLYKYNYDGDKLVLSKKEINCLT